MALLEWSDAWSLGLPCMDDTHREFMDLLAVVATTPDEDLLWVWHQLIVHTEAHFAQEDRWMLATRFASGNCHSLQHKLVLKVLREGQARGEAGDLQYIREMAAELGLWFLEHTQSMDAALALHVRRIGFDPASGLVAIPDALPAVLIQGCGGASCSDQREAAKA